MRPVPALHAPLPELELYSERLLRGGESFPPCDVVCTREGGLRIVVAVAGFGVDDLAISAVGDQLVVRGRRRPDARPRHYLHRGIAMRRFQRSFQLGAGLQVKAARLENGLLNIELQRTGQPAGQSIPIGRSGPGAA